MQLRPARNRKKKEKKRERKKEQLAGKLLDHQVDLNREFPSWAEDDGPLGSKQGK